jgi:hypothetical protein
LAEVLGSGELDLRLSFLTVERVDATLGEHMGEDKVLENLNALRGTGFVVRLERLEEIDLRLRPVLCAD